MLLSSGTVVTNCTSKQNVNDGYKATGRVMISDSIARSNGLAGFRLNGTGMIKHCFSSDNQQGIRSESGMGLLILENDCTDNSGHGIWMNGATGCRIEGNQCFSNGSSGIFLKLNGSHLAIRNTGRNNTGGNFVFDASSDCAQVMTNPGPDFVNFNAWANFSY